MRLENIEHLNNIPALGQNWIGQCLDRNTLKYRNQSILVRVGKRADGWTARGWLGCDGIEYVKRNGVRWTCWGWECVDFQTDYMWNTVSISHLIPIELNSKRWSVSFWFYFIFERTNVYNNIGQQFCITLARAPANTNESSRFTVQIELSVFTVYL